MMFQNYYINADVCKINFFTYENVALLKFHSSYLRSLYQFSDTNRIVYTFVQYIHVHSIFTETSRASSLYVTVKQHNVIILYTYLYSVCISPSHPFTYLFLYIKINLTGHSTVRYRWGGVYNNNIHVTARSQG